MNNILVTGAKGQLGSEIKEIASKYSGNFIFTDVEELDICNYENILNFVEEHQIESIINCAAYTAVDKAETSEAIANSINNLAVENLAKIAKLKSIKLIHISTDYVFDGNSKIPYTETVFPNPQSVYGKTKLAGEEAMLKINPVNSIIIRTAWVYSSFGNNFVKTMLNLSTNKKELNIVADQFGSPTYARDLAVVILDCLPKIKNNQVEIFHYSNEGKCSWYNFAKAIFELKGIAMQLNPIETSQYPTAAKRPTNSELDKTKIKNTFQITIPNWESSLAACLEKL